MKDLEHILARMIIVGLFKDSLTASKIASLCAIYGARNSEYVALLLKQVEGPTSFMWNTVIRGYEQSSNPWEAIHLYHQMLQNMVLPDKFTFPFVLKACTRVHALLEGEQIHCQILKSPHQMDMFVQNSIILMYVKCGKIEAARTSFDLTAHKNSICWNTMIDGYIKHGNIKAACQLFDEMPQRDLFTWNAIIDGHTKCGHIEVARKLFNEMPIRDIVSWNCMIYGYAKRGNMKAARELFDKTPLRDVVTWTIIVNGYAKYGKIEIAHILFEKMPFKSLISWNSMLDGYAKFGNIQAALTLFELTPHRNLTSWNIMLDAYAKCKKIKIARQLFDKMPERDIFSWNIMIDAYASGGSINIAQELFDAMPQRDVVSWNALIAGYKQNGQSKEAIELFHHMQMVGEKPDCSTLAIVLSAIADLGLFAQGRWIHTYVDKNKFSLDGIVGVAIIDMYCKCGNVDIALGIFDCITHRNIDHWNSMISGLAIHGCGNDAIRLFEEMRRSAERPDDISFIGVLSACSHSGLVHEGCLYFELMSLQYGITPKIQHYGCMVDLLSRAGHLEEARELVKYMPMRPNNVVWRALLGASRNHGNIEIAEHAAKHLIELEPDDTSSYVLLSNIYSAKGRWKCVTEIRKMMTDRGIVKAPGCSSIELNGIVHEFIVGDISHSQIMEIHILLHEMSEALVWAGYAPDTKHSMFDTDD
ncbi:pentatricopeptide repeat-containing protein At1g08070, chloroplastic-like [Tasmannia lanceolata]|uniref:pentatricopeptide repeat-containing protein At1g08070, chloroplastic-like n=1 Tax=Tasmannia lanceolata TaxID=3420 RepID=UPI004062BD63